MNRRITFADHSGLIPLWYAVHCSPTEDEWRIENVEVYADASLGDDYLIGDDLWHSLPQASQDAIYAKLDELEHERRERQAHIKRELALIANPIAAEAERDCARAVAYHNSVMSMILGSIR